MSTANWFTANAPAAPPPTPAAPPPTPAAPAGGDWFTQHAPGGAQVNPQPATMPSPAHDAQSADLAAQPDPAKPQGTYQMKNTQGAMVPVTYGNVHRALDQGLLFVDKGNLQQYARDLAADPLSEARVDQWLDKHPYMKLTPPAVALNQAEGFGTGVMKTWTGADRLPTSRLETEEQLAAAVPIKGPEQAAGEIGENIAEFVIFGGEELGMMLGRAGQAMGITQKLKTMAGLSQMLEKAPPMVSKLLKIGMSAAKQGTVAGGQTYAKTGDAGAALRAGAGTGLVTGAFGAAGEGLASAVAHNASTMEDVGGVPTPVTAAERNVRATPRQAAGKQAIAGAAQDATGRHLVEVNESRAVPENAPGLPAKTGPFTFNLKGVRPQEGATGEISQPAKKFEPAASRVPENAEPGPQNKAEMGSQASTIPNRMQKRVQAFTTETGEPQADVARGGGMLQTQDANIAKAHVDNLNSIIEGPHFDSFPPEQQSELLDARADAQKQLADYHEQVLQKLPGYGMPNFPQIDIPTVAKKVGSWADTASTIKKTATDGYKQITDALAFTGRSPQELSMVRKAYQSAEEKFMAAETPQAMSDAATSIEAAHEQLRGMLKDIPNAVSLKEFAGMNDAYKNALGLQKISKAIDGSFHGSMSSAQRSFEYSGFDGAQLQSRMDSLIRTMGRNSVERLMGRDNLDTVLQVAQLNNTLAKRARWGQAVKAIAAPMMSAHLSGAGIGAYAGYRATGNWEGAAAGAVGGAALGAMSKRVMDVVLTNPKIAQNLIYSIHSGASPEKFGPLIGTMIQKWETEGARERVRNERGQQ
jgi:hypothetical protein